MIATGFHRVSVLLIWLQSAWFTQDNKCDVTDPTEDLVGKHFWSSKLVSDYNLTVIVSSGASRQNIDATSSSCPHVNRMVA